MSLRSITIEINVTLIQTAIDKNKPVEKFDKTIEEATGEKNVKQLPYPDAPSSVGEAMGHEFYHGEKEVTDGNGGTEADATNSAKEILSDK